MGVEQSTQNPSSDQGAPRAARPPLRRLLSRSADPEGSFVFVTNDSADVFHYDPEQTHMVAYGINDQTYPKFREKSLKQSGLAALQVVTALIDKHAVPQANTALYTATKDPDACTYQGIKASFMEAASRVGEEGLLIFHFTGHGLKTLKGEWGLAPLDFDFSEGTFITSESLNRWLHKSGCKARYVIFTLDCCYAGGIGNDLTAGVTNLRPGLYVLSACTAFETSLVVGPLGQSLFAYFLAYAIRRVKFEQGTLPVSPIFDECGTLCTALSSLFMSYRGDHIGLQSGVMKPEFQFFDPDTVSDAGECIKAWLDDTMVYSPVDPSPHHPLANKLTFVMKYYKRYSSRGRTRNELSDLCLNWLIHISQRQSPLNDFACRGLLNHEILSAVLCAILWSVASIQLAANDPESIIDPNMFLIGFVHAAAALNSFHSSPITLKHLEQAWHFYQAVAVTNKLDDAELREVHEEIERDLEAQRDAEAAQEMCKLQPVATSKSPLQSLSSPIVVDGDWTSSRTIGALSTLSSHSSEQDEGEWSLDVPGLSTLTSVTSEDSSSASIWPERRQGSIMPSMKMESIRPILRGQCSLHPHHFEDAEVVADSIVLHVLQPHRLQGYLDSVTAKCKTAAELGAQAEAPDQTQDSKPVIMWEPLSHAGRR